MQNGHALTCETRILTVHDVLGQAGTLRCLGDDLRELPHRGVAVLGEREQRQPLRGAHALSFPAEHCLTTWVAGGHRAFVPANPSGTRPSPR